MVHNTLAKILLYTKCGFLRQCRADQNFRADLPVKIYVLLVQEDMVSINSVRTLE